MIMYRYALDESGKRVSIEDVFSEGRRKKFICPSCAGILNPRALNSNVVTPHFYHLNKEGTGSSGQCSSESYLHWISKELLAESLRENKPFIVKYETINKCIHKEASPTECIKSVINEIDIVKEFPYVYVETKDEEYVPDIMLRNNKGEKIYIEIYNSSDSSLKKRNSDIRIIQVKVEDEKDIESIINKRILKSSFKGVEFINFKPDSFDCKGDCDYVDRFDYSTLKEPDEIVWERRTRAPQKEMMKNFCLKMRSNYSYDDKRSSEFSVVYKGKNLWYISCCNQFFCVAHFEMYHFVYDVEDGEIVYLAKDLTFSGLDSVIRQYVVGRDGVLRNR